MRILVFGISSDIALYLSHKWIEEGHQVVGTYRTFDKNIKSIESLCEKLINIDFSSKSSISKGCEELIKINFKWDVLINANGGQSPVGLFEEVSFDEWDKSINFNFINQMNAIHKMLPNRCLSKNKLPIVISFSGGGTNNAPKYYSAYTLAKISLIKAMELLAEEVVDTCFVSIGVGWTKTKLHRATLDSGERAGENLEKTKKFLNSDQHTDLTLIKECFDWAIQSSGENISGRNFSVVHDLWGYGELDSQLELDTNMYKLRRSGNSFGSRRS